MSSSRLATYVSLALVCAWSSAPKPHAQSVVGPAFPVLPGQRASDKQRLSRVLVVDDAGCRFSRHVQVAIDAARDGDVVLIRPGSYGSFVIDGKAVSVFAEPGPTGTDVRVQAFEVRNLRADQQVVVRGLVSAQGIVTDANEGPVWIEGCSALYGPSTFDGSTVGVFDSSFTGPTHLYAEFAGQVTDGTTLIAYASSFRGEPGADGFCYDLGGCFPCNASDAVTGGHGLRIASSDAGSSSAESRAAGAAAPAATSTAAVRGPSRRPALPTATASTWTLARRRS